MRHSPFKPLLESSFITPIRYPGQEAGDIKVPSIIYYDDKGNILAIGAEEPGLDDSEEDQDTSRLPLKVEWCVFAG